ncbi:MAG: S-layer homology domain-containing protein [Clostridia bacterium]|nr:S-layer homology domain-containing protein [Clostridia bacterium]
MKRFIIKIGALTLCFLMLFNITAFGATTGEAEIAGLLGQLSIMNGYPDGELRLEQPVTRAEFSKITVAASPYKNQVASSMAVSPFADVNYRHWAAPYVKLAVSNKLVTGYPDATFRPDQTVLFEEAVTIYLRLLGYTNDDFGYSWPYGQIGLAQNIGLLDNISVTTGTAMSRRDVMLLTYNLLTCSPKGSTADYLESIQYKLVEDIVLIATSKEDPSVNPGKVSTTAGQYRIDDSFNHDLIGMRGDAILKNGDTVVSFVPYTQNLEEYVVYSTLNNAVVTYKDGNLGQLDIDDDTMAYVGTQITTYKAAIAGMEMGDLISVQRDSRGEAEYITVRGGSVTGPVIVRNDAWYTELSVNENITVIRDGVKGNTTDIETYDVVYYSPDLNMVLAYSQKVTGIYESAYPNKDQLTQVTVSGVTYQVESVDAFNALSSNGGYNFGDTVTLLLGKNGEVAGVAGPSAAEHSVMGYLQSAGVKQYTNQAGDIYSNFYITVVGADGKAYEYAAKRDYSDSTALHNVVRVNFSNGLATVATLKSMDIYGTVNAEAKTAGGYRFADGVNILDVIPGDGTHGGAYASVFLQQLNLVTLSNSNVLYYGLNRAGEIDELILKNATGECYQYGIVTKATSNTGGTNISGSYSYDVAGRINNLVSSGKTFNVRKGQPVQILVADGKVQSMKGLTKLSATYSKVTGNALVTAGGTEHMLSDDVVIYKKVGYDFTVLAKSELSTAKYRISAYCDRAMDRGGKIRVIIAEAK